MNPDQELRLRRARPADADGLSALRFEFRARHVEAVEAEATFHARCAEWMRVHLAQEATWRAWVLESDDGLEGMVWLQIVQKLPNPGQETECHGYLTSFFVREPHRGRGAGARLLSSLLQDCVALDVDCIFLWPTDQSRPLYSRHGFHPGTSLMVLQR